jgi:spermidine synthase
MVKEDVATSGPAAGTGLLFLFALTLLVGAALLFVVQPMMAKLVLPLLGGSPAVWNTCMVFFQAALLAGYAYAHATTAWLGARRQAALHAALLLLALCLLPLGIPPGWVHSVPTAADPSPWLLGLLVATVGLPFFAVSTTAPLLQRWFSATGHPTAHDPYFLYGASNLGSLAALLGYPLVVEPNLRLQRQSEAWAFGYGVLMIMILACAAAVWRAPRVSPRPVGERDDACPRPDHLGSRLWVQWVSLSFLPSSLLLGVTTYISTDLAAVPLLWVVPLALYLLTFILVFARRQVVPHALVLHALPIAVVMLALVICLKTTQAAFIPVHLVAFFVVAMACHGELVKLRPSTGHLTAFYLAISVGGVLGGILNALVAPVVFNWVAEYPLALALACLVLPGRAPTRGTRDRLLDLAFPAALGLLTAWAVNRFVPSREYEAGGLGFKLAFGLAVFLCYIFKDRPVRFAFGVGAVLLASQISDNIHGRVLYQERNFFGVLRVSRDGEENYHRLIHGNTVHGQQSLDPRRRREPLTYYHRTGPIGQVFAAIAKKLARSDVAVVGLGAGSLACYAESDQRWTFFEIDPAVLRIARDPNFFTYLADCRATSCDVVLGDARLRLRDAPDSGYGLIVLDAFSSDAIPMHLLTREALELYRRKLADGGLIAFHISNRYLDLTRVLRALARDAGLVGRVCHDQNVPPEQLREGKYASSWFVMAARDADLGTLADDPRWEASEPRPGDMVWTDDFSNLAALLVGTK